MDIRTYVDACVKRPASGKVKDQFAVLAFDLGLHPSAGHPPPTAGVTFTDRIDANGGSGPWCVLPHNWSPVANPRKDTDGAVIIKKDRKGQDDVYADDAAAYGQRETIHAERSLAARIKVYSERYQREFKTRPQSVSLYSYYSPCRSCIKLLKQVPSAFRIPQWYFGYTLPFVTELEPEYDAETAHYPDAATAIAAVAELRSAGWHIL